MANRDITALLSKPLDDCEPRDIAQLAGETIDRMANVVEREPTADERAELVAEMRRLGRLMLGWARFGRWTK